MVKVALYSIIQTKKRKKGENSFGGFNYIQIVVMR